MTSPKPLDGFGVVELAGLGPAPFASGILADLGADVVRIERPGTTPSGLQLDRLGVRDCVIVEADLKGEEGMALAGVLLGSADVVLEAYRPGVAERLGVGPVDVHATNPRAIYTRITGWGQDGPYSHTAGHDINYLAVTGGLNAIGSERPVPPLNLVGDYAGGSLFAVIGILAALVARSSTGEGGVVDAAMVDGVSSLLSPTHQMKGWGVWVDKRNSNLLDGRAPFYRTYETKDGKFMAVGALEPQFYALMLDGLGIDPSSLPPREEPRNWDAISDVFSEVFASKRRDEWVTVFEGSDACVTPVLTLDEAASDPHAIARGAFRFDDDAAYPTGAPRFGGVPPRTRAQRDVSDTLMALGLSVEVARDLESRGASYRA